MIDGVNAATEKLLLAQLKPGTIPVRAEWVEMGSKESIEKYATEHPGRIGVSDWLIVECVETTQTVQGHVVSTMGSDRVVHALAYNSGSGELYPPELTSYIIPMDSLVDMLRSL